MKNNLNLSTLCLIFISFSFAEFNFTFNSAISQINTQQIFPDLAIDDNGIIHVVWVEQSGNSKNIFYNNSWDNGITFSEKTQVNSVNGHVVAFGGAGPRIRINGENIYIVWADSRNGYNNTSIYLNQSNDNGYSWNDEIEISDQPHFQLYADIEIDDLGFLHLIYYNYGNELQFLNIHYSKIELSEINSHESMIVGVTSEEAEPCDCCAPDLEVTGNGDVYIAYRNNIENIRDHYITKKLNTEIEFSESVPISILNDYIGFCPSSSPSIYIENNQMGVGFMNYSESAVYLLKGEAENLQFGEIHNVEPVNSINNYPKVIMENSNLHAIWVDATEREIRYTSLENNSSHLTENKNLIITDENVTQVAEPKLKFHQNNLYAVWSDNRSGVNNIYFSSTYQISVISGDVNEDEIVNIVDILLVVNYIMGNQSFSTIQLLSADMNSDSTINILDVIQMINVILGNI